MNMLKELYNIKETSSTGSISASSVAINSSDEIPKKDKTKRIYKEDKHYDKDSIMSQIKNAEETSKFSNTSVGFALEDDTGNIVKVYVKKDQAAEFESALNNELSNNQNDEHSHREIGEIIYSLKDDFNIVNIEMGVIPEDEEEVTEIESESKSELELEDESSDGDDSSDKDDSSDESMVPNNDTGSGASTLSSVIDMMKADALAREADANAKIADANAKIASLNAKAAESQVKKSEEIMDMESHYNKKSDQEKESKQLAKLAQYKHEMSQDETVADRDYISDEITPNENEEVKVSSKFLNAAINSLLKNKNN